MRKFILVPILILLVSIGASSQTITFASVGIQDLSGITVEVEHYVPGGTSGIISSLATIPADRGQASNVIFSTANSDQGSVLVNFPTGYTYTIGASSYTTGTLHANAWMAFPSSSYNGYSSAASSPNVPTIHFTSVNNGSTDNNMSHVSWETYNDATYGDVFRIRYEGSYKYSVSGINTKIDLYFLKSDPAKCFVVLRTFLADGSNQEQIGLSNGSTWLAANLITNATYASGVGFQITNAVSNSIWVSQGSQVTNSSGSISYSNSNNYSYKVHVDASGMNSTISQTEMNYLMYVRMFPSVMASWDFHTCDFDGDNLVGYIDILESYGHYSTGAYVTENAVYSQSEKDDIEVNATTFTYHTKYPRSGTRTFENLNRFYIVTLGKHRQTSQTQTIQ